MSRNRLKLIDLYDKDTVKIARRLEAIETITLHVVYRGYDGTAGGEDYVDIPCRGLGWGSGKKQFVKELRELFRKEILRLHAKKTLDEKEERRKQYEELKKEFEEGENDEV